MVASERENSPAAEEIEVAVALAVPQIRPKAPGEANVIADRLENAHPHFIEVFCMQRKALALAGRHKRGEIIARINLRWGASRSADSLGRVRWRGRRVGHWRRSNRGNGGQATGRARLAGFRLRARGAFVKSPSMWRMGHRLKDFGRLRRFYPRQNLRLSRNIAARVVRARMFQFQRQWLRQFAQRGARIHRHSLVDEICRLDGALRVLSC